jgi:hypothetical protein
MTLCLASSWRSDDPSLPGSVTLPSGIAPWGGLEPRSRWALALGGEAVALAVADEMAGWARRAADWAGWAAAVSSRRGGEARGTLEHAQSMLTAAGAGPGRDGGLDAAGRRELLRAIPLYEPPDRVPPHEGDGHADLRAGIMASAERLRAQAFMAARHPDPGSGPGWERSARACAIASDLASRAMPMLARQAAHMGVLLGAAGDAETAATALAGARGTWRALAGCWRVITTDAQDPDSPLTADMAGLVVRMGRLVSGDPRWTPAWRQDTSRDAARIAPDEHGLRLALAAIHDAADAIEYVARADLRGVQAAATAGRLYMPARIIGVGVVAAPRPYVAAPQDRTYVLQCAGQAAIDVSARAARTLDSLAVRCGVPSRPLAMVRAAVPAEAPSRGLQVPPAILAAALRELDRPRHAHRQQAKADPQAIITAYVDYGLTTQQISWVFRVTSGQAAAVLREHGIAVGEDRGRGTQHGQRAAGQRVQTPRRPTSQAAPEPRW